MANLWFSSYSDRLWFIPVLDVRGTDPVRVQAAQVCRPGVTGYSDVREGDATDWAQAQVGDWIVEDADKHRVRFSDADFRQRFRVDPEDLLRLGEEYRGRATKWAFFVENLSGEAYRREMQTLQEWREFSDACIKLAERGEFALQEHRSEPEPEPEDRPTDADRQAALQEAVNKIHQAFAGELPVPVWITRTVRQDFPADLVQKVMREIAERGGDNGEPVSFDSVGRHRDTALDALLRSGSSYTLGVPVDDSLSQKQWAARGIRASEAMVQVVRDLMDRESAEVLEDAQKMPFNSDGFFDDVAGERERSSRESPDPERM